jgi:hypothetical protein
MKNKKLNVVGGRIELTAQELVALFTPCPPEYVVFILSPFLSQDVVQTYEWIKPHVPDSCKEDIELLQCIFENMPLNKASELVKELPKALAAIAFARYEK